MNLEQTINDRPYAAALFFGCLAAVLFHPLFFGKFVLGGTDVLYAHYPNILYGYREFQEFGNFSLWNRYIFSGMDFTGSMHAHFLNPLYWPLLLFPEKYIFHALTAGFMAMNALTGWFWSRTAVRLGVPGSGSLIVGVVAQAGMFFWFAMTTMIAVPMYLCASIAIYLIITHETRGGLANYLALSLVLGLMFVTPHPAYILGFFLPVLVLFFVQAYPGWIFRPWRGLTPVFVAACLTALLLSVYRLVPVGTEIVGKGALLDKTWLSEYVNHAYFGLTAFNPLALGISLHDSQIFSQLLHLGAGRHAQAHNALYFGIVPLVIVYTAIRAGGSTKVVFLAAAYIVFQFSYLHVLQPLSDIVYLVLYPLGHEGIYRPVTAIIFLFLLINSLKIFAFATAQMVQKAVRECVVISGLVIAAWGAMYAKVLYGVPAAISKMGFQIFVNSFRTGILGVLIGAAVICCLPLKALARPRSGLLGVLFGIVAVAAAGGIALAAGFLSETEMMLKPLKNGFAVVLACIAVLALAGLGPSKMRHWAALVCGIAAVIIFLLPALMPFGNNLASAAWAAAVGWGTFIALVATSLAIMGLFANRALDSSRAMKLMLVLTVADLVVAFGNYSYVNVLSSPFIRHLEDIYPTQTLQKRATGYQASLAGERDRPNLLVNAEFHLASGQPSGWGFGGRDMTLCPPPHVFAMKQGNSVRVCYPGSDAAGNFYQDVTLRESIRQVAMGIWIRAEPGMEVGLFLTSPSNNIGSPVVRNKGDGKWHWMEVVLEANEPLKVVRPHINMAKPGHAEIYAPRLVSGIVVRPALRPTDGQKVVESKGNSYRDVDLASYRVNHVHILNGFSGNELMTNLAIVAGTPTYAGVDSDLPSDYVDFLKTFKSLDPSWYHRAGLYSSLEDKRLLDLLGVGYDVGAEGGTSFRPDAIPRLAAFSGFEVQRDRGRALQRLRAADFEPTTTVLLQSEPALSRPHASPGHFQLLPYKTPAADRLTLQIPGNVPRLVLFNDRFSSNWEAYWNGKLLKIVPANFAFMAVALPEGAGELSFVFNPRLFIMLAKIGALTAVLLLLLSGVLLLWKSFGRAWPARRRF